MYFWDKHKTGARLASIVHYHDGIGIILLYFISG